MEEKRGEKQVGKGKKRGKWRGGKDPARRKKGGKGNKKGLRRKKEGVRGKQKQEGRNGVLYYNTQEMENE